MGVDWDPCWIYCFLFFCCNVKRGDSIIVFLVTRIMEFPNFLISFSHLGSRVFVFVY